MVICWNLLSIKRGDQTKNYEHSEPSIYGCIGYDQNITKGEFWSKELAQKDSLQ